MIPDKTEYNSIYELMVEFCSKKQCNLNTEDCSCEECSQFVNDNLHLIREE